MQGALSRICQRPKMTRRGVCDESFIPFFAVGDYSEVREIIEEVRKVSEGLNNHIVPPIREMLKEGQNVNKLLKELSNHYENIRRLLHHSHDFSVA